MRVVLQRVSHASVSVDGKITGEIEKGLCILLGVAEGDGEKDADWLAEKIVNLRIFEDADEKLNLSLLDVKGSLLIVSQFTLFGDCRKGRRPSFTGAARPEEGNRLYEYFLAQVRKHNVPVETGVFQTHMMVNIVNDGPVTLILDTSKEL